MSLTDGGSKQAFFLGLRDASPTYPGVISFALIAGVSSKAMGLSSLQAITISVLTFSGTAQLASLQLFAEGAGLLLILLTVALVNFRYMMYSAALLPFLKHLSLGWRSLLAYVMVDQSFAFGLNRFQDNPEMPYKTWYYLGISLPLFFIWGSACTIGVLLGAQIPANLSLEFSLPLVFLALTAITVRNKHALLAALAGGVTAALFANLANGLGLLIAAISGVSTGLLSERFLKAKT